MTKDEMEKEFEEVWALVKENARQQKKTDELVREMSNQQKQTEKQVKETSVQLKKTDEKLNKLIGNWGKFVAGLVLPATKRLFRERGIIIDKVYQRVNAENDGCHMEIDIFAIDGEYAVLIEAKSSLSVDDVKDHITRMKEFKKFFPEYSDKIVLGAVAGASIEEQADRYAYKKGFFVIAQSGESVNFLNDESFVPKQW